MILIILGVFACCGLLALIEVYRNGMFHDDACYTPRPASRLIQLPADLEREKRRRNIL